MLRYTCFTLLLSLLSLTTFAQESWNSLPPNMYADTAHFPFGLGVASNEPTETDVTIWTYTWPDSANQVSKAVNWEIATDSNFSSVLQSGAISADSANGFTAQTRLSGLAAGTYYWYRFNDGQGNNSAIGRTQTLPANAAEIKLGVTSCSSVFSGYFNSYQNMALRNDLNAVVHLGDFTYDFVDSDEEERLTDPYPANIDCGIAERRRRYFMYMLDADMRRVRQQFPFIQIWDNHDVGGTLRADPDCIKTFREWTGMPVFDNTDTRKIYRKISLGTEVDLFMIDVNYQDVRDIIAPGEKSYLGNAQYAWLTSELKNSTAKWKLVANQKMFTPFSIDGVQALLGGSGTVLTTSSWDGFQLERTRLLTFLDSNEIDNVMILSGDMHFGIMSDLPIDALDPNSNYDPDTHEGSVAVSFLPTSVTRGNLDERGIDASLNGTIVAVTTNLNPYHQFTDFIENGYGILNIASDSISAELWFNKIRQDTDDQWLAKELTLYDGANHWSDEPLSVGVQTPSIAPNSLGIYPNPTTGQLNLEWYNRVESETTVQLSSVDGRLLLEKVIPKVQGSNGTSLDLSTLPAGIYEVSILAGNEVMTRRVVKN